MESDIKYIDELTNDALKNYTEDPISSWNNFNEKFGSQLRPNTNLITNLGLNKILITIVSFSIVAIGVFYYQTNEEPVIIKKVKLVKNNLNDNYKAKDIFKLENQNVKSEEKTINTKKSSKIANEKDVIVKVRIPIHKRVEVRKQIIIKDSTN